MPPVPNVILASPRRTQPCPTSEACWSPASAAIGGAPGQRARLADHAGRVDDRRHHRDRHAEPVEHRLIPRRCVARLHAGDGRVRRVGHVHRAARERPRDPGVDGSEAEVGGAPVVELIEEPLDLGRRLVGPDAHALRAQREARADRAQVLPAEPRTDRHAGRAIPHDGRAALVGDADRVDRAVGGQRGAREIEARFAEQRRVELHEPVGGGVGQQLPVVTAHERAVGAHDRGPDAARADVDDEHPTRLGGHASRCSRPGDRAEGAGEPELARVEDAVRVERVLHACSTPNPAPSASATNRLRFRPIPW